MQSFYTTSHKTKSCDLDGRAVRYVDAGSGEPVLLLHGYPQSALCWRHQLPTLAGRHRVIAPDWPGYGRSETPATAPTYDNEVERIGQFADRIHSLGLRRAARRNRLENKIASCHREL